MRKAIKMDAAQLKKLLVAKFGVAIPDYYDIVDAVPSGDFKVVFDGENSDHMTSLDLADDPRVVKYVKNGLFTLSNGFTFYGAWAGGDWQSPVYYILYYDGKKFRVYIPHDGNPFNDALKCAYGDTHDDTGPKSDMVNVRKRFPGQVAQMAVSEWESGEFIIEIEMEACKFINDIIARITVI